MFLIRNYGATRTFVLKDGRFEFKADRIIKTENDEVADEMRDYEGINVAHREALEGEEETLQFDKPRRGRLPQNVRYAQKNLPLIPVIPADVTEDELVAVNPDGTITREPVDEEIPVVASVDGEMPIFEDAPKDEEQEEQVKTPKAPRKKFCVTNFGSSRDLKYKGTSYYIAHKGSMDLDNENCVKKLATYPQVSYKKTSRSPSSKK